MPTVVGEGPYIGGEFGVFLMSFIVNGLIMVDDTHRFSCRTHFLWMMQIIDRRGSRSLCTHVDTS